MPDSPAPGDPSDGGAEQGRRYAGQSDAERRAGRRARLVAAGLELFGSRGYAGTSIERLCSAAQVSTRYFYEEFSSREALLAATYDDVVAGAFDAVRTSVQAVAEGDADSPQARIDAALRAYVGHLLADPRRVRIVHQEVRKVHALAEHRSATVLRTSAVVQSEVGVAPGDPSRRVLSHAVAGAVGDALVDWLAAPEPRPSLDDTLRALSRLVAGALLDGEAAADTPPAE